MHTKPTPKTCGVLLDPDASQAAIGPLLGPIGLQDWAGACHILQRLAPTPETENALLTLLPNLLFTLSQTGEPDRVLVSLDRFARQNHNQLTLFIYLNDNPRALEILCTLFAGSQFLSEFLLRNPEYFHRLVDHKALAQIRTVADFKARIEAALEQFTELADQLDTLRRFQRWQLLRIGTCDLLGLLDMSTVTAQLSYLAESLIQTCLTLIAQNASLDANGFVVLGMGKLGGAELNYSSDIDLIFLAQQPEKRYDRLGKRLIDALTRVTAEGFLYRVDMRLRPWGKVGALVPSRSGYLSYLHKQARLWEKQALLKARPLAGDIAVGDGFLTEIEPLIFAPPPKVVQTDVREMKQRIEDNLRQHGRKWGEVKLGEGSIRDIEFVTQYLQLAYGDQYPQIRNKNTMEALNRLNEYNFISQDDHHVLTQGYTFLRSVEHWLQMMHYHQTHTLSNNPQALTNLARRLGFQDSNAGQDFLARYEQHTIAIRLIYQSYLEPGGQTAKPPTTTANHPLNVQKHLARLTSVYATTFNQTDIERHAMLMEHLNDQHLVEVEPIPLGDDRWQITIVGYDYLGVLSLICGLFFIHHLDILEGHAFTYRQAPSTRLLKNKPVFKPGRLTFSKSIVNPTASSDTRRKIVDVFIVRPIDGRLSPQFWQAYMKDLLTLFQRLEKGGQHQAQGELAKKLAALYRENPKNGKLYPVDIEIDNTTSERRTVLHIDADDTVGFLYEFTNALALAGIYISRVSIGSAGKRVHDVFHIADKYGRKITNPTKLQELRATAVLIKHFTHLLPNSPNPESALRHFRQFVGQLFTRPNWPAELTSLEQPAVLQALARLLGVSDFLWFDFLRMQHANLFPVVRDVDALETAKSKTDLQAELQAILAAEDDYPAQSKALNAFKDREMFRIDMRHILGHITELNTFAAELTDLAEVLVERAYTLCRTQLTTQYGQPQLEDGAPSLLTVCALGKCGGRELGFASDIELMFIYADNGQTRGPEIIPTAEFFEKLVQQVLGTIQARQEGIFELDLRLRPYGRAGSVAVPLALFKSYYAPDGPAWPYERQALIKLRPIAGDSDFGEKIITLRDSLVYTQTPFDVAAMRGMRERQVRHLVTPGMFNAKYSPGGLVDIEYLVQGLQITHGYTQPKLRLTNTAAAMQAMAQAGILSDADYQTLQTTHTFLQHLLNALRMVNGNAKDLTVPPFDSEDFAFLARRLHYGNDLNHLRQDLTDYTTHVAEINGRLLTA